MRNIRHVLPRVAFKNEVGGHVLKRSPGEILGNREKCLHKARKHAMIAGVHTGVAHLSPVRYSSFSANSG